MRTIHRIGIGVLVGIFFATGYAVRMSADAHERTAVARESGAAQNGGTRIASMNLEGAANVDFVPLQTLLSVVTNLRQHYVEQLTDKDEGQMTYEALKSMLASLNDPNTRFVEPTQRKVIADAQKGKYHGIGAALGISKAKAGEIAEERLTVVSVLPDSPAEKAGLKTGDQILAIDGKAVLPFNPYQKVDLILKDARNQSRDREVLRKELEAEQKRIETGLSMIQAEDLLSSEDKKAVELTVLSQGAAKEAKVKVQPGELTVDPVQVETTGDYAYIRVNCFCSGSAEKFADAMKTAESSGAKGLVLDLRNLSGGQIEAARQMARWFVPGKTLAQELRSHDRKTNIAVPAAGDTSTWKKPVAVLVDRGTARVAEVMAAALRDNGRARLVGETTYGDFGATTLIDLKDGSAVLMTTGHFLTSKGGDYAGKGVAVDVQVAMSGAGDSQRQEAVNILNGRQGQ